MTTTQASVNDRMGRMIVSSLLATRPQHVQDRVGRSGLRDAEPDAHHAGPGLLDESESLAEPPADRALQTIDQPEQVLLGHRVQGLSPAPPEGDWLEQYLVVRRP